MSANFRLEGRALPVKFEGKGLDATAGVPPKPRSRSHEGNAAENRYLFVTFADFV